MPSDAVPSVLFPLKMTVRQRELRDLLDRVVSEGATPFFRDALRILNSPLQLEASSHLAIHMLREIESSIRAVLEPLDQEEAPSDEDGFNKNHVASMRAVHHDKRLRFYTGLCGAHSCGANANQRR